MWTIGNVLEVSGKALNLPTVSLRLSVASSKDASLQGGTSVTWISGRRDEANCEFIQALHNTGDFACDFRCNLQADKNADWMVSIRPYLAGSPSAILEC
jgi:hypothetical protein